MKYILSFFLLLSLSTTHLKSQSITANIGLNHSNVISTLFKTHYQRSLALGVGLNDNISSRLSWNLDGMYSIKGLQTKGVEITGLGFFPEGVNNLRIHYLEVLPSIEVHLTKFISFVAGASAGINVLETYNGDRTPNTHNVLDLGLISGLKVNADRYSFKVIANPSLTPSSDLMFTDINGNPIESNNYKNINFQATLGIRIFEFDGYNY